MGGDLFSRRLLLGCVAPAAAFFAAFWLLPAVRLIALPGERGAETYFAVLTSTRYLQSLTNTVLLSVLVTLATLVLGCAVGIYLARREFIGKRMLLSLLTLPLSFPGVIVGFFLILLGADVFNAFLALSQLPVAAAEWIGGSGFTPYGVMALILLFYILLGAVMDELAMILLTLPIFFPIVQALDFGMPADDVAIWFGILVLIVVGIGLTAPPIGLNVFVVSAIARHVALTRIYRAVLPFIAADIIRLGLVMAFPALALATVRLLT